MKQHNERSIIIVFDSSTIIDLVDIGLIEEVLTISGMDFRVPNEVVIREIIKEPYIEILSKAIKQRKIQVTFITEPHEMRIKSELSQRFGEGEAACMAIGINRGWLFVCEERGKAFMREVERRNLKSKLLRIENLLLKLVSENIKTIRGIEKHLKKMQHRFTLLAELETNDIYRKKSEHINRVLKRFREVAE